MKAASPGIITEIPEAPGQYNPAPKSFSVTPSPWDMMSSRLSNVLSVPVRLCSAIFPASSLAQG